MIKGDISTINAYVVHGKSCLDIAQDIGHFLMLFYYTFREAVEFIHFRGLKKATRRSEIRNYFRQYGEIADMYVGNDNGHHTGNFYLQFCYKVSAELVRQMSVHEVDGSILRVYAPGQPFER